MGGPLASSELMPLIRPAVIWAGVGRTDVVSDTIGDAGSRGVYVRLTTHACHGGGSGAVLDQYLCDLRRGVGCSRRWSPMARPAAEGAHVRHCPSADVCNRHLARRASVSLRDQ